MVLGECELPFYSDVILADWPIWGLAPLLGDQLCCAYYLAYRRLLTDSVCIIISPGGYSALEMFSDHFTFFAMLQHYNKII